MKHERHFAEFEWHKSNNGNAFSYDSCLDIKTCFLAKTSNKSTERKMKCRKCNGNYKVIKWWRKFRHNFLRLFDRRGRRRDILLIVHATMSRIATVNDLSVSCGLEQLPGAWYDECFIRVPMITRTYLQSLIVESCFIKEKENRRKVVAIVSYSSLYRIAHISRTSARKFLGNIEIVFVSIAGVKEREKLNTKVYLTNWVQ